MRHTWLAVVSVSIFGCAMSAPADLTTGVDPTLPSLEAANDVTPAQGGGDDSGVDAGLASGKGDAGGKPATPDAGVDSGPSIPKPSAGELLVTEVMYAPFTPEPSTEWFELHSLATAPRSLSGLIIKDGGSRTHVIGAGVTIAPGAYVLLVRNKAAALTSKIPSSVIAYEYASGLPDNGGVLLTNSSTGGVSILDGATVLATAPYGGWFSQTGGSSVQLKVLAPATAATKASWCLSFNAWTTGADKGTPGAASDCP